MTLSSPRDLVLKLHGFNVTRQAMRENVRCQCNYLAIVTMHGETEIIQHNQMDIRLLLQVAKMLIQADCDFARPLLLC